MRYLHGFVCPACHGVYMDRSAVRWYERLLKLLTTARPYRCYSCRRRYWLRTDHSKHGVSTAH